MKRKTAAASQQSANVRKKQRASSEAAEATPTGVETLPSSTLSSLQETQAIDVTSEVGPISSVVGASVAGPSTGSANLGADLGAKVEETGVAVAGSSASVTAINEATTDVCGIEGVTAS